MLITKDFPAIIHFADKYEFDYYAENLKEFYAICLKVLEDRIDSYFYKDGDDTLDEDEILSDEEIEKLPKKYREQAKKDKDASLKEQKYSSENNRTYDAAKKAVKTKNGELAYQCLCDHQDGEYEYFEIKSIEDMRLPKKK